MPVTMPPVPQVDGYLLNPADPTIRTDMESGPPRARRTFYSRNDKINVAWLLTDDEMALFRLWFDSDDGAAGGSKWFTMPLATGDGGVSQNTEARFASVWQAVPNGVLRWKVTATLEVRRAAGSKWDYYQAFEVPTLDLDFISDAYSYFDGSLLRALDDPFLGLVTYTRNSVGTYYGPDGLLKTAAANVPRIDYDPVTLACRGFLIEKSGQNVLTYSELFSDSAWAKNRCSIVDAAAVSPDGTSNAAKLVEDTTVTNSHVLNRTPYITSTANAVHTVSCYAKAGERSILSLGLSTGDYARSTTMQFDLLAGVGYGSPSQVGTVSDVAWSIKACRDGWYRCTLSAKFDAVSTNYNFNIGLCDGSGNLNYTGNGTSGLYVWGAQLEAGSAPSSYIPTTTAAVTRAQDRAYILGEAVMRWARADEGALLVDFVDNIGATGANQFLANLHVAGFGTNRTMLYLVSAGLFVSTQVVSAGVVQANFSTGNRVVSAVSKAAFTFRSNDFYGTLNGGAGQSDLSGAVAAQPTRLEIGADHIGTQNCIDTHIRRLRFFPFRVSNTRLQELTA